MQKCIFLTIWILLMSGISILNAQEEKNSSEQTLTSKTPIFNEDSSPDSKLLEIQRDIPAGEVAPNPDKITTPLSDSKLKVSGEWQNGVQAAPTNSGVIPPDLKLNDDLQPNIVRRLEIDRTQTAHTAKHLGYGQPQAVQPANTINYRNIKGQKEQEILPPPHGVTNYREMKGATTQPPGEKPD